MFTDLYNDYVLKTVEDVRLYFISIGFVPADNTGMMYVKVHKSGNMSFFLDMERNTLTATIPDYKYNQMYPQAGRNNVIKYDLTDVTSKGIYCKSIKAFLDKIIDIFENKKEIDYDNN